MSLSREFRDDIAVLTLDRPETKNAIGPIQAEQIASSIAEIGATPRLTGLVLTGRGAFSSGGDLIALSSLIEGLAPDEVAQHIYGSFQSMIRALKAIPVPTVAAIDGPAIGLGMDLALACDVRIVGSEGWMMQGWGRAGLIAGTGGVEFLEHLAPTLLWELLADQPRLGAAECERLGLGRQAAGDCALDDAIGLLRKLRKVPRDALAGYVQLSRERRWPSDAHLAACGALQGRLLKSNAFGKLAQTMISTSTEAESKP
jgi:enoyl-CoA hydratase/carnithine racemase